MRHWRATALWVSTLVVACAGSVTPEATRFAMLPTAVVAQAQCNGAFSDGSSIKPANPVFLADVPGNQEFCDFHTFAWNQFLVVTSGASPPFLSMAPWYNLLKPDGAAPPTAYPGGSTTLQGARLDKQQAGDSDQLVDVAGRPVLYDIRVNQAFYDGVVSQKLYTASLYAQACAPNDGVCRNLLWLPPNASATGSSIVIKTAWRDFQSAAACPGASHLCVGRLGLVGLHLAQKTATHGEWIWASFEHAGNAPDCSPGADSPIAPLSPAGTAWSFFNPGTAPPSVMSTRSCSVVQPTPQCNGNPRVGSGFVPVNICRTEPLPAGGASAANCAVETAPAGRHLPNDQANNAGNVACLNATFQPQRAGVWKNYKLVGTVWTRGTMSPTQDFRVQAFQAPAQGLPFVEAVGFPHLANTTMETYMQAGSTGYDPIRSNATSAGCFNCHNLPSVAGANFNQLDLSHVVSKFKALSSPRVPAQ